MSNELNDIVKTNQDALSKLTSYANAYQTYQSYLDTSANCFVDPSCALYSTYNAALNDYMTKQQDLLLFLKNSQLNTSDSSYNYLVKQIDDIGRYRGQINNNKGFIDLNSESGIFQDSKLHMDYTMYASLCWTLLATSVIYFVFVEP